MKWRLTWKTQVRPARGNPHLVGLESRCGLRVTVGSNPTPSASGAERIGRFVQPTLGNLVVNYQLKQLGSPAALTTVSQEDGPGHAAGPHGGLVSTAALSLTCTFALILLCRRTHMHITDTVRLVGQQRFHSRAWGEGVGGPCPINNRHQVTRENG